ncbi:hypothetical protein ACHHYP_00008 [Achlya hypogyna]|uniref:Uncharacterized protein n=1 Tax=Achlya hypogyna TaxID=1202772 RepID=A0A1V9ZDD9_ACHHY|nr:hypothetical protein ACHHYP_00008 [Achlya hypogyna]
MDDDRLDSLGDLHAAAQAGLHLLESNAALEEQVRELESALASAQNDCNGWAAKYDACWKQRCDAMYEVNFLLKANKELRQDIVRAQDKCIIVEREAMKLENRLVYAETSLRRCVQERKERRASIEKPPPVQPTVEVAPPPAVVDVTQLLAPYEAQIEKLKAQVASLFSVKHELDSALLELAAKDAQLKEIQMEQQEERDLITSMRESIDHLKQVHTVARGVRI